MSQQFYADDFFALAADPGIVVGVKIRGREVPITLKRGMTLADKSAAQSMALKKTVTSDGRVVIDGLDESILVEQLLLHCILDWPFIDRTTGEKFPVTLENIRLMLGGVEQLAELIAKIESDGTEALAPFVPESDEA